MKRAICRVFYELPGVEIVNTVHDELVCEAPAQDAEEYAQEVQRLMTEAGQEFVPDVPIVVDGGVRDCWSK
jgi:DNA polymerase I-like protein with 3'-5' exonuclease and polymerase domains